MACCQDTKGNTFGVVYVDELAQQTGDALYSAETLCLELRGQMPRSSG
jgi:hypothetical protein